MTALVSVIIPAYNIGELIFETIKSALDQSYKNIEVLIVDDGSTDDTEKVITSINDDRIHYIYQNNSGLPAVGRNKAVSHSHGKYLAFLDHDDLWLPDKLMKQVRVMESDAEISLVSSNGYYMYGDKKTKQIMLKGMKTGYMNERVFFPGNKVFLSTALVRKSSFSELGGFNENRDLLAIEDFDLWIRMIRKHRYYYMDEPLAYYRMHNNATSGTDIKKAQRNLDYYQKYFLGYGFNERINRRQLGRIMRAVVKARISLGEKCDKAMLRDAFLLEFNPKCYLQYVWAMANYYTGRGSK